LAITWRFLIGRRRTFSKSKYQQINALNKSTPSTPSTNQQPNNPAFRKSGAKVKKNEGTAGVYW